MRCLIITLLLILSYPTFSWAAVELDSDSNGAIDVNKGGTNATTTTQAKLNLGLSNVDNTSDANKPVSTATQTALDAKANISCFADTASFNDCFALDWPTGGTTYTAGTGITITDGVIASTVVDTDTFASWDKDYNDLINKPTIPDISGKEDSLGNPSVNGYVLSSTTSGVRSWVEMTGGGTGIAHATADGNYYASKDGGWASLTGLYAPALGADDNYVTDAEKTKIAGIAEGAEVNVNADWNSSSGDSQILNKPTIVTTVGATGADTNIPSEQAVRESLNLKADVENIAFLAGALTDLKIKTTAQPTNGEPLIDDTVTYGAIDDNLRLWSIDKIGSELAGKAAASCFADATSFNDCFTLDWPTDYLTSTNLVTGSTDNAVIRADGTGGKTTQASGVTIDDSDNLTTTGTLNGKTAIVVNSGTSSYSVTQAHARANTLFLTTNAATTTYTLPAAEAGMIVCFKMGQGNSQILRIDTDGTDYIVKSTGTRTSAAGDYYGATASATNRICVAAYNTTDWYVESEVGTWTEE